MMEHGADGRTVMQMPSEHGEYQSSGVKPINLAFHCQRYA